MAALFAVLNAIARATWRSFLGAFAGNNLVVVIAFLMAEEPVDRPSSTSFFYLLVGLLYTIPLALELHRRIPAVRLQLWPLTAAQRVSIYLVNLLFNPLFLLAVLFAALSRHKAVGAALFAAGLIAPIAVIAISPLHLRYRPSALIPRFPGRLGGLIQSHLREMTHMLDFYFTAVLSAGGIIYVFFTAHPDPYAPLVLGHLLVILMSTLAQAHLAFDADATATRLHLLPLTPMQLLLAKDAAWGVLVLILIAPYIQMPILAAALVVLAVGHTTAPRRAEEQRRWHLASGVMAPTGVFQILACVITGSTVKTFGVPAFAAAVLIYAGSLFYYQRSLS